MIDFAEMPYEKAVILAVEMGLGQAQAEEMVAICQGLVEGDVEAAEEAGPASRSKQRWGRTLKGGAGSGNFNHAGIPGHLGGSAPAGTGGGAQGERGRYAFEGSDKDLARDVREVVDTIQSIHSDGGKLKDIPVKQADYGATTGAGGFVAGWEGASHIEIKAGDSEPMMTLTHEMGHHLDYEGGRTMNAFSTAALNKQRDWALAQAPAAARDALSRLGDAIRSSKSAKKLESLRKAGTIKVSGEVLKTDKRYVQYLQTEKETFARAYAQYIATKAGPSSRLYKELDAVIRRERDTGSYPTQWSHEDFTPIASAFDDVFGSLGWKK